MSQHWGIAILWMGLTAAALAVPSASEAAPINLVPNGDFSDGLTGFASDYTLSPSSGWDPSTYTVTDDPGLWHPAFASIGDHTTGSGQMFVGNGSTTFGARVWESDNINVVDGQLYYFEAYVANVCCTNYLRTNGQSRLNFRIAFDGGPWVSLGLRETDALVPGRWDGLSTDWTAPSSGTVSLSLVDVNTEYDANDFALDDVYFGGDSTVTPEPATLALLLGALPLAEGARRRRVARDRQPHGPDPRG